MYLVEKLKNKRIAMVNATSYGGGVAEKLHSIVPLMKDMGLDVDWWTIFAHEEFFRVTKTFLSAAGVEESCPAMILRLFEIQ